MGILSDFFIADATPVPNYDGGEAFDDADKCQYKGLTPLQGGQFLAVLRGQDYVVDMVREFRLVTPEDAEPDQIPALAAQFSGATAEELGWHITPG